MVVWPPEGEVLNKDVDMSLGLEFSDQKNILVTISISRDDNWTPEINCVVLTDFLPSEQMDSWLNGWMKLSLGGTFQLQNFDFSDDSRFIHLIGKSITDIKLASIGGDPFGVKLNIDSDHLMVVPISDGATVVTSRFGDRSAIEGFEYLGQIIYKDVN